MRTKVDDLYMLSGIAFSHIRRTLHSQLQRLKQEKEHRHQLQVCKPVRKKVKSKDLFSAFSLLLVSVCTCGAATLTMQNTGSLFLSLSALQNTSPWFQ